VPGVLLPRQQQEAVHRHRFAVAALPLSKAAIRSRHDMPETRSSAIRYLQPKRPLRCRYRRALMDERDQELLEKQMRGCQPPPPGNAALTLFGATLFVSGLILGSLLFAPADRTEYDGMRTASQHTPNGLN
jgi:hypothetical protein